MRGIDARRRAQLAFLALAIALVACGSTHPTASRPTATATPISTVSPTATPVPVGLSVQGTRFYSQGHAVTLVGVNHSAFEYSCAGDGHFTPADFQAMKSWGANVVRIPLSSEYWANAGGACPAYHETVRQAIASARAAGLFVIVDLQWNAPFDLPRDRTHGGVQCQMPDTGKDVTLWQDFAALYRDDTGVLFDLFGEPHDVSWSTWLNGGWVANGCDIIGSQPLQIEPGSYHAIGMRDLVAKIRAIAPQNVIIIPGLTWGYDLSGITQGFALQGTNLVYDTHPFDYSNKQPGDWPSAFGSAAQRYPVMVGEFGSYDCGTSYIAQAIGYFNAHHISWLAWAWWPGSCSGPSLLADWSGAPSVPYGSYIKQQMLAAGQSRA
jgi:endoglucanase